MCDWFGNPPDTFYLAYVCGLVCAVKVLPEWLCMVYGYVSQHTFSKGLLMRASIRVLPFAKATSAGHAYTKGVSCLSSTSYESKKAEPSADKLGRSGLNRCLSSPRRAFCLILVYHRLRAKSIRYTVYFQL